jgi:hypothetical protein
MAQVQRGRIIIEATFHFTIFDIANLPMERKQQKLIYLSPSPLCASYSNAHQNTPIVIITIAEHFYVTRKNAPQKVPENQRRKQRNFLHHS